MKIILVTDWFSEKMGYSENCLAEALGILGHEVHVVTSTANVYCDSPDYDNVYRPLVSAYLGRDINAVSIKEEQKQYARKIIQSFYGQFTIDDNLSFIDIGGSTGTIGQVFKDEFNINDITILDPIDEELNEARKLGFKSISGLLETWDNPDNLKYDIVFCGRTIDHFKDIKLSLQKLKSLLKSNGVLLIDIIDLSMIWQRREIIESSFKIDHCQYLNNMNAVEILGFCGLEVIFSEIASHPERVTYICKSTNPKSLPSFLPTNAKQMISDIQKSKIIIADMWNSPYTYRQKFYRCLG